MAKKPDLPCLQIPFEKMTARELQSHISRMIRCVTGPGPGYGNEEKKPKWWPDSVDWCSPRAIKQAKLACQLRKVVVNCYTYYGMEEKLKGNTRKFSNVTKSNRKSSKMSPRKRNLIQNGFSGTRADPTIAGYAPVPVSGPLPTKLFTSLQEGLIPTLTPVYGRDVVNLANVQSCRTDPASAKVYTNGIMRDMISFVEIFVCFFCEKEFGSRKSLRAHQDCCAMKPPDSEKGKTPVLSRLGFVRPPPPTPIPRPRWCTKPVHPDKHERAAKGEFVEYLDLLPKGKVDDVQKRIDREVDCEDLDFEDEPMPKSPTPAKSKMTLLRPDSSPPACITAKKSLPRTVSITSPQKVKSKDVEGSDSDAESECSGSAKSESSDDSVKLKRSAVTMLLSIPLSSTLGHRVRKHIEAKREVLRKQLTDGGEKEVEISSNYEKYCHTPRKSEHYSRMRIRAATEYPVTFNKKREVSDWKCHKYKFTWRQNVEFWKTVKTGLNLRARKLKDKMKQCSVLLKRLTKKEFRMWLVDYQQPKVLMKALSSSEIEKWSKKHSSDSYMIPMILDSPQFPKTPDHIGDDDLKRLLGLRNQQDINVPLHERNLTLSQCVSENVNAEVTQQKAVVYKTLLKAMDRSVGDSALTPPDTPPQQSPDPDIKMEPGETPKRGTSSCPTVRKLLSARPCEKKPEDTVREAVQSTSRCNDSALQIEPITKLEPMVFYGGGKEEKGCESTEVPSVKKWNITGGILVPLVEETNSNLDGVRPADDFIVTVNNIDNAESSSTESSSPNIGNKLNQQSSLDLDPTRSLDCNISHEYTKSKTDENVQPKVIPAKRPVGRPKKDGKANRPSCAKTAPVKVVSTKKPGGKPRQKKTVSKIKKVNIRRRLTGKGKSLLNGKYSATKLQSSKKVSLPSITKKKPVRKNLDIHKKKHLDKGTVDESDDDEVILSDRSSLASESPSDKCKSGLQEQTTVSQGIKRKRTNKKGQMSSLSSKKAKATSKSKSPKKKNPDGRIIMFKCHLCGVELHAELGDRDFIAEHYQETHDVHNIRLRENVSIDGLRTVSVIQDVPKTPPSNAIRKQPSLSPSKSPGKKMSTEQINRKNGQVKNKRQNLVKKKVQNNENEKH